MRSARRTILVLLAVLLLPLSSAHAGEGDDDPGRALLARLDEIASRTAVADMASLVTRFAAGEECRLIDPGGDETRVIEDPQCAGVRPGALARTPTGDCTFGYHFVARGEKGEIIARYMATAGHCIIDEGLRTWGPGAGPIISDANSRQVGQVAYARVDATHDFALVSLFSTVLANSQVCVFGGPIGIDSSVRSGTEAVSHYGQGIGISAVMPARSGVSRYLSDYREVRIDSVTTISDSGSPLVSANGRALGMIKSIIADPNGAVRALRLRPQMDAAGASLGQSLELVTAPRATPIGDTPLADDDGGEEDGPGGSGLRLR